MRRADIVARAAGDVRINPALLRSRTLGLAVQPRFTSDDLEVVREAVLAGVGVAVLPRFIVGDSIDSGALQVLPASVELPPTELHSVVPAHPIANAGAQIFTEFLRRKLTTAPDWKARL